MRTQAVCWVKQTLSHLPTAHRTGLMAVSLRAGADGAGRATPRPGWIAGRGGETALSGRVRGAP
jgi:hypothetical protein